MKFIGSNGEPFYVTEYSLNGCIDPSVDWCGYGLVTTQARLLELEGEKTKIVTSNLGRVACSTENILFYDTFMGTNINANVWKIASATTMTAAQENGMLRLNSGNSVASNTNITISTCKSFPFLTRTSTSFALEVSTLRHPQVNTTLELGAFLATGTGTPTTGVYWRVLGSGVCNPIVNYSGSEVIGPDFTYVELFSDEDKFTHFEIEIDESKVNFYVNNVLKHIHNRASTVGTAIVAQQIPISVRQFNGSSGPAASQSLQLGMAYVAVEGTSTNRFWHWSLVSAGGSSLWNQTGTANGQTCNYANNTNPTAQVPTNTTAALGTGLGGQFWETFTLAVNTDAVISSYQVPLTAGVGTNRNLYITEITISSFVQTTLGGGPLVETWFLAYGHTAVSLATAEAATTKAPRRVPIGVRAITAAATAGTNLGEIKLELTAPIVVYPGEFIAVCKKHIGTVGTTGVIAHNIQLTGWFE